MCDVITNFPELTLKNWSWCGRGWLRGLACWHLYCPGGDDGSGRDPWWGNCCTPCWWLDTMGEAATSGWHCWHLCSPGGGRGGIGKYPWWVNCTPSWWLDTTVDEAASGWHLSCLGGGTGGTGKYPRWVDCYTPFSWWLDTRCGAATSGNALLDSLHHCRALLDRPACRLNYRPQKSNNKPFL